MAKGADWNLSLSPQESTTHLSHDSDHQLLPSFSKSFKLTVLGLENKEIFLYLNTSSDISISIFSWMGPQVSQQSLPPVVSVDLVREVFSLGKKPNILVSGWSSPEIPRQQPPHHFSQSSILCSRYLRKVIKEALTFSNCSAFEECLRSNGTVRHGGNSPSCLASTKT